MKTDYSTLSRLREENIVVKKCRTIYTSPMKTLKELGLRVPEILLPANVDLSKWSVIACDQYTQDLDYWKKAEAAAEAQS